MEGGTLTFNSQAYANFAHQEMKSWTPLTVTESTLVGKTKQQNKTKQTPTPKDFSTTFYLKTPSGLDSIFKIKFHFLA